MSLLELRDLHVGFRSAAGLLPAVDGVSLGIERGETVALVGESGCGKSVLALSILGLLPPSVAQVTAAAIRFDGRDLARLGEREMQALRGRAISMIFQEPMTALNPVRRIGDQIAEVVRRHLGLGRRAAWDRAVELLELVRIPAPAERARDYPHQLSGGMRQRVVIAIALACDPTLLIADEPTTALDVTIQAQILALLLELQERTGTALLLITHDLGVVAETAERVVVMYAGRIVEAAPTRELFARPQHPYTRGLLAAIPRIESSARLADIPGMVPSPAEPRRGCLFQPRCGVALDRCRTDQPPLERIGAGHDRACWTAHA